MDNNIIVAFLTGLTAGGISCLAIQGGLLSSAIAHQAELDIHRSLQSPGRGAKASPRVKAARPASSIQVALPISLFLVAKLAAYTLLGALLGFLGQVFYLSPMLKGLLQIAIGVFMLGNGLRILKVHPIFRYFNFEPPQSVTRFIRRTSKDADAFSTPLLLGLLTVLIPCGITQSMMALAMGLGSPMLGAAVMFAFILGTMPVFFGVTYLATKLSSLVEGYFMKIVAVVLLVLGAISVNTGLVLMGSPVSFNALADALAPPPVQSSPANVQTGGSSNSLVINVTNSGYSPARLVAPAGQDVHVRFVSKNTNSCALAVVIPSLNFEKVLPPTGEAGVDIPAQTAGSVIPYSCSMGMYSGQIVFK